MWLVPVVAVVLAAPATVSEADVMQVVRERFERTGRTTPTDDAGLNRAALALAKKALRTSAEEAAGLLSTTEALSREGAWDASPIALFIKTPVEQLLDEVRKQEWPDQSDQVIDSMGVGLVVEGRQASLCVLMAQRRLELKPFARRYKKAPARPPRLCATLLGALTSATVFVTRPKGDVDEIEMVSTRGEWCADVPIRQVGRSAIEVLARGPKGPEVAALFFVDVGVSADETDRAFVEPTTTEHARAAVLARVNLLRLSQKFASLEPDPTLDAIAQKYAERMATEAFFGHVAPDGSDLKGRLLEGKYLYTGAGENLGSSSGPLAAHFGIEHSPAHRKNLLDPHFRKLGVGLAKRENGITILTEVLATPLEDGAENPVALTYQALNQVRAKKKLPALTANSVLEALAQEHAREALKREQPNVQLNGVPPLSDRVFKALEDVKAVAVDVYVTQSAAIAPESKNVVDLRNSMVGVGIARGDTEKFGPNRFWVVVIYGH